IGYCHPSVCPQWCEWTEEVYGGLGDLLFAPSRKTDPQRRKPQPVITAVLPAAARDDSVEAAGKLSLCPQRARLSRLSHDLVSQSDRTVGILSRREQAERNVSMFRCYQRYALADQCGNYMNIELVDLACIKERRDQ